MGEITAFVPNRTMVAGFRAVEAGDLVQGNLREYLVYEKRWKLCGHRYIKFVDLNPKIPMTKIAKIDIYCKNAFAIMEELVKNLPNATTVSRWSEVSLEVNYDFDALDLVYDTFLGLCCPVEV